MQVTIVLEDRNSNLDYFDFDLDKNFKEVKYEDTEIYQTYKMYLDRPYLMQERLFDESDEE